MSNTTTTTIDPIGSRGIRNVSRVSCHIACAVQILCHAIPTIRSGLRQILEDSNANAEERKRSVSANGSSLLEELLDFVRIDIDAFPNRCDDDDDDDDGDDGNDGNDDDEQPNRDGSGSALGSAPPPWNPERLYAVIAHTSNGAGGGVGVGVGGKFSLDPHTVGDATRSLSCLLHLLSHEGALCGQAWKRLLESSVWEGETRQILRGRRRLVVVGEEDENGGGKSGSGNGGNGNGNGNGNGSGSGNGNGNGNGSGSGSGSGNGNGSGSGNGGNGGSRVGVVVRQQRFLERTKPALRNKPMASPLILKFRDPDEGINNGGWSVVQALEEVFQPQTLKGSNYPWDSLSPDTYSEREIVCSEDRPVDSNSDDRSNNECDRDCNDDSSSSSGGSSSSSDSDSDSDGDGDGSSDNSNDSSSDSDSDSSDDSHEDWITSKQIEVRSIPRAWLLHLDRPQSSVQRFRRMAATQQTQKTVETEKEFSLFDHIQVPIELKTSSILTHITNDDGKVTSNDDSREESDPNENGNEDRDTTGVSPKSLFLRGAIVQVLDVDDDDNDELEEDWEGGHSVTLLRIADASVNVNVDVNVDVNEPASSWVLVDDDRCTPISQDRALRMMGGVTEANYDRRDKKCESGKGSGSGTGNLTFFSASLLVYSVADDDDDNDDYSSHEEWKQLRNDLVSSWNDHGAELDATARAKASLVGKRLRIQWAKGTFYAGTITRYDFSSGTHQVTYDDGDVKEYDLEKKTLEWIDPIVE